MKKSLKITALSLFALAAAIFGAAATAGGDRIPAATAAPAAAESISEETEYTLKETDGFISVYEDGELRIRTEIPAALLRGVDRQALQEGITVSGRDELLKLIEDLGS